MNASLPVVGQRASLDHAFSRADIAAFAALCGDDNPVHLEDEAARDAGFDGVIAHGILVASLISRVLGTQMPGPGTIYLGQQLTFRRPVYAGALLHVELEVLSVREDKPILELATRVDVNGERCVDGTAAVLVRSR